MRILAIDTTGPAASAAVYDEGAVTQAYLEDGNTHSQKIQRLIDQAMKQAGCKNADLTGIAVANGPGSFTGIRIGVAMAKAMAQALSLPILGVCTLDVLACQADKANIRCAVMDARRKEVYCVAYRGKTCLVPHSAMPLETFLQHIAQTGEPACFAGDAVRVYWETISHALGEKAIKMPEPVCIQQARTVACLAAKTPLEKWETAASLQPNYLRISQAERERLQREKHHG